jgi:hypothetical protein
VTVQKQSKNVGKGGKKHKRSSQTTFALPVKEYPVPAQAISASTNPRIITLGCLLDIVEQTIAGRRNVSTTRRNRIMEVLLMRKSEATMSGILILSAFWKRSFKF